MARYDEYDERTTARQKDLVLNMNEYAHLLSKTDGNIKCAVGPYQTSLSQQEVPVVFNTRTKRFEECNDYEQAKQLFVSAPEGWYVVLKNPAKENSHPEAGRQNQTPTSIEIGKKINIFGPTSFALFPGQMAKVIRGHRLRSNQYLLARVYDAVAAKAGIGEATILDAEGNAVETTTEYFVGQLLVIKGTEVSFYIPPTGIEVIPVGGNGDSYVRDAVTLERLEYAILKDEDGEKRYIHGPSVVFPKPTEVFVTAPKGGNRFRALELSPISGIYVKVIAAYDDKDKNGKTVHHPIGEELFITGKDQMIYYPRPEHALIQYDGKYMHHAIAIPEGEGRYILNRLSGEIKTVKGPAMYLPDPRTEVVVKRKLSKKECKLIYPSNNEVLEYNLQLSEKTVQKMLKNTSNDILESAYSSSDQAATLAIFEANANISRGTSYTKPRTITLDTKYEGAVGVEIWNGYAVNVISKKSKPKTVIGPASILLDYDQTLESVNTNSTCDETVYLKIDNDMCKGDVVAETKDNVQVQVKLEYRFSFSKDKSAVWFSIKDYYRYLTETVEVALKDKIKEYPIKEFFSQAYDIINECVLAQTFLNGMSINNVYIDSLSIESEIGTYLDTQRKSLIKKEIDSIGKQQLLAYTEQLKEAEKKIADAETQANLYKIALENKEKLASIDADIAYDARVNTRKEAEAQAKADMQKIYDVVAAAENAREKAKADLQIGIKKEQAELEKIKQNTYAETVASVFNSISPDLAAALTSKANAQVLVEVSKAVSPYAIAHGGESVADVTNKLLRGTSLEQVINQISNNIPTCS